MEISLDSYNIKSSARENLEGLIRKTFLNMAGWSADKRVCEIEIKGQKGNEEQIYKYNCEPSIWNDSVNKTTEQQRNENVCPGLVRDDRPLTKSQSMPDFF